MTLQERVAACSAKLTTADRALLEVLLSHVREAAFLPAAEVARRAGVHQASATKLAQRLGYSGYPALRASLQRDLLDGASAAERMSRRLEHTGDQEILGALVADEAAALSDVSRQVSQESLNAAADLLIGAGQRFVFGRGNSRVLVELLTRRLRRFGLPVTTLSASGRDIAEQLVAMQPDDVVVSFAFLHLPAHLEGISAYRKSVGAHQILVTDTLGGTFDPAPDITLAGARGSGREFQSLTVPMAITNALVLTVARRAHERTTSALQRLEVLLSQFETRR